jgi:2-polyprenyl-3-methyl-5-hydroxy-6-metoxy-1,4-benzoquinol methylase
MKLPADRTDPAWARLREHDVQELWDTSINPHVAASYQSRVGLLCRLVEELAGPSGRVLDVGCAQGTLGLMLGERGIKVDLLDVRAENIEYARERYQRGPVDFHVGLLSDSLPPYQAYDVVTCTEVIEHVPSPAQFLEQLMRKLRPGGALCLTTPNGDYVLSGLPTYSGAAQTTIDEAEPNSLDGDAHRFLYTRAELIALLRGIGLRIERCRYFLPLWLEGHAKTRHVHRLFYELRRDILRFPATLPEPLGRLLCSSQYVIARKP